MRLLALFALPALVSAAVVRRSNCAPATPVAFNLAIYNTGGQPTGQYLGHDPDPETHTTAPDGSPIYVGYAATSLPSSAMFQLSGTTWALNGGIALAHQDNTYDLAYFADAANAAGLPVLSCSFDASAKLVCSTPSIAAGQFALCGADLAFYDGVSATGCPGPITNVDLYKV